MLPAIGRRNCTAWHIPNNTACHQEQNLSAAGFPTVCITACQSRHCFTAMNPRIQPIIFLRIFSASTTAARLLFMNWSTSCLSRGSRLMNPNTVFLPSPSRRQPEESLHHMSAPAQAVPLPIYRGVIVTGKNSKYRNPKVGEVPLQVSSLY